MVNDCIFCKLSNGGEKVIYENDNFFSVYDIDPFCEGHALVISKKHFENIFSLPDSLEMEFFDCIKKTSVILMKLRGVTGLNIIQNNFPSAGQVINHVHFHLIPRRDNDGVKIII